MKNIGFSDDAAKNFIKMTELVAEGNAKLEGKGQILLNCKQRYSSISKIIWGEMSTEAA